MVPRPQEASDASTHTVALPESSPAPAPRRLVGEAAEPPRRLGEREIPEPRLGALFVATLVVAGLAGAAWWIGRRLLRGSKLFAAQGAIQIVGRRALAPRQELVLVDVGGRLFLLGATRERVSTLGEFSRADDVAAVRARFAPSPREERTAPAPAGTPEPASDPYAGIAEELASIRTAVQSWKD